MISITHARTAKAVANLRARLLGAAMENKAWYKAVDALEFALESHDGMFRKKPVTATGNFVEAEPTPYVLHPVDVARFALTLPNLTHRIDTIVTALLHDVMEDCGVTYRELEGRFGTLAADGVEAMSKKLNGVTKSEERYMRDLAGSVIGSICKPSDRINNQLSLEVFTPQKALQTVDFTESQILPMMKAARRRFPEQELAYENMKLVLQAQIRATRAMFAQATD